MLSSMFWKVHVRALETFRWAVGISEKHVLYFNFFTSANFVTSCILSFVSEIETIDI